jgi:hydroxyacylglutathione hydrolase
MTEAKTTPIVEGFALGDFQTNCYLIRPDASSKRAWIADVGFDPGALLDRAAAFKIEAIVLTHCHVDHIAGLFEARTRLGPVPIFVHGAEAGWLTDPMLNLSAAMGLSVTGPEPDRLLAGGEDLELCGQVWKVLETPGHSPGGITLLHEPSHQAIVGDALFAGSIGRTDFPGSNFEILASSIREKLYPLPDETIVYPGHGPMTTIGAEKSSNPFVRPLDG